MKKMLRLTESDLHRIIKRIINESEGGYGIMNTKTEMGEQSEMSGDGSFVGFLKEQGFKDWSQGKPESYGMEFHYISRKPKTPANLSCAVSQEKGQKTVDIDIVFDEVIAAAESYKTMEEYNTKSPIPKIEKLTGIDFESTNDYKTFRLYLKKLSVDTAKQVILLYNQIRMVGPYSK